MDYMHLSDYLTLGLIMHDAYLTHTYICINPELYIRYHGNAPHSLTAL